MKKIMFLLFILFAAILYAAEKQQDTSAQEQPKDQTFVPVLTNVDNSISAQNDILSNSYRIEDTNGGHWTVFRIHKNWFLTCAHGPFMEDERFKGKSPIPINISVKEYNAPGAAARFALVVDLMKEDNKNAIFYKYKPNLSLTDQNTNRGYDLALIYIPDEDPYKKEFKKAKDEIKKVKEQLNNFKSMLPENILSMQKNAILKAEKELSKKEKENSSIWQNFLNTPIKQFRLLNLSEKTVVAELGYPGKTAYSFRLNVYNIHGEALKKFYFTPIGTHKEEPNAIFYQRVNNLIPGTSGSAMTYGNYVVSIDSAVNCSPMFTDDFAAWLKQKMGRDYSPMFIKNNMPQQNDDLKPLEAEDDSNWNDAKPANPGPLHPHRP